MNVFPNSYILPLFLDEGGGKKQQAKSTGGKPKAAVEQEITITRLDIRVGLITKAQKHPDADSLYVKKLMWEIATSNCCERISQVHTN